MVKLENDESIKLKTLCEFLFSSRHNFWASFEKFEKCFQPLFNHINNINLYNVFISIVGNNKKYIIYPRFVGAYLKYKNGEFHKDSDAFIFFDKLLNKILKSVNDCIGQHEDYSKNQNIISLSSKRAGMTKISEMSEEISESFMSKIQVINDKDDKIRGIILEFDDTNKSELYPKKYKNNMYLGLEINLGLINKKNLVINKKFNNDDINMSLYRDGITHIFGTVDKYTHTINFLGFKCISGKMRFFGIPDGEPFLFGEFGKKFDNLRLEINKEEGITLFEPGFIENKSVNYLLKNYDNNVDLDKINDNLFEENILKNLDENKLNQLITTTIIEEDNSEQQEPDDKNPGYDYKEIINLKNRNWIINKEKENTTLLGNNTCLGQTYISSSETSIGNTTILNPIQGTKDIYSYNGNPFCPQVNTDKNIKIDNPFFPKVIGQSKIFCFNNEIKKHKHTLLFPKKEIKSDSTKSGINYKAVKNSKLRDILKKRGFNSLLENLGKSIFEEFYNKYSNDSSLIPFSILNHLYPIEIDERERNCKKKIIPKKRELIINGKNIQMDEMQEIDFEQIKIEENEDIEKDLIFSDAAHLHNEIMNDFENIKKDYDKSTNEFWIRKWQYLSNLKGRSILRILLQTIWFIIKIMNKAFIDNKKEIEFNKKIKYYKILTDKNNEKIIDFLTQKLDDDNEEINDNKEEIISEENSDEDNELFFSVIDYDAKINDLNTKMLDKNDKKTKLKKYNYSLRKNTYIENVTNFEKEELMLDENLLNIIENPINDISPNAYEKNEYLKGNLFGEMRRRISWEMEKETQILLDSFIQFSETITNIQKREYPNFHGQLEIKEDKDPNFIPNNNSLCPNMKDSSNLPDKVYRSDIQNWELIKWKKLKGIEIFKKNSSPEIDNIRQGEYIGDCYFLSALGSLCEKYDYLKNLIEKVIVNGMSVGYRVKLNINGKWKYVLVDKYFPFIENNGNDNLCFGSSFKRELWVSLFEKAFAKISGCYARIGFGGKCGDAFDILTDAYSEFHQIAGIDNKRKEELWEKLKKAKEKNYVICAGTRKFSFLEKAFYNIGLIDCHAYTMINVYDKTIGKKRYQLVKLRNPWGEKEYNGDWSDKSSKWKEVENYKNEFEFQDDKDDGIFYMSYEHFLYYFRCLEILKIEKNYKTMASCKISKANAYRCQIIKFRIKEHKQNTAHKDPIKVFINLYQKNPRIIRKNGNYYPEPVKSFIILAKKDEENNYQYIKSITGEKFHLALEVELQVGVDYYIFCDVNYRFIYDEIYGYNITFYSRDTNEIECKNITNDLTAKKRTYLLNKVLYNFFKNYGKQFDKRDNRNIDVYKLKYFSETFPFTILLLKNTDKTKQKKYFTLNLNNKSKEKQCCIYNDSDASEFDSYVVKEISNDIKIILIMGNTLTADFNISIIVSAQKPSFEHPIFKTEPITGEDFNQYYIRQKDNGYILGLENIGKKDVFLNIEFVGTHLINPEYNILYNENNEFIRNIYMKSGDKKIFNLRLKPGCNRVDHRLLY